MTGIRAAVVADFDAIVALNAGSADLTSAMDHARLESLHAEAAYHRVSCDADTVTGFLLVFDENAAYDSPNFRWFVDRYDRFLYVDRIVVDPDRRGEGIGAALYRDLFAYARDCGVNTITCEYNRVPLNETSRAFHARFGFVEVGRQWHDGGRKQVSHQLAEVE